MLHISLLVTLFCPVLAFSQATFPCSFKVIDAHSQYPVKGALVTIDQASFATAQTDLEGLCHFSSIPEGRIDVSVSHIAYKGQRLQQTVSAEKKNNAFVIQLSPIVESNLLIEGKVQNSEAESVAKVNVEIKIDGKAYETITDASGNYQFNINAGIIRNDKIQFEFKKGKCKYEEQVPVPEKRYLTKNVVLACDEENSKPSKQPLRTMRIEVSTYLQTTIRVKKGQTISITASGSVIFGPMVGAAGPDGVQSPMLDLAIKDYNIVKAFRHGALLVKFSQEEDWKYCGHSFNYTAQADGTIFFNLNDNNQRDNSGSFNVKVEVGL